VFCVHVHQDGTGFLEKDEIKVFMMNLLPLADPVNDTDCICAALDIDGDGKVGSPRCMHGPVAPHCPTCPSVPFWVSLVFDTSYM
jgi:hypothetical protein